MFEIKKLQTLLIIEAYKFFKRITRVYNRNLLYDKKEKKLRVNN